jgi:hypothetical protein
MRECAAATQRVKDCAAVYECAAVLKNVQEIAVAWQLLTDECTGCRVLLSQIMQKRVRN